MNIMEKSYTKIVMDFIERNGVNHGKQDFFLYENIH